MTPPESPPQGIPAGGVALCRAGATNGPDPRGSCPAVFRPEGGDGPPAGGRLAGVVGGHVRETATPRLAASLRDWPRAVPWRRRPRPGASVRRRGRFRRRRPATGCGTPLPLDSITTPAAPRFVTARTLRFHAFPPIRVQPAPIGTAGAIGAGWPRARRDPGWHRPEYAPGHQYGVGVTLHPYRPSVTTRRRAGRVSHPLSVTLGAAVCVRPEPSPAPSEAATVAAARAVDALGGYYYMVNTSKPVAVANAHTRAAVVFHRACSPRS